MITNAFVETEGNTNNNSYSWVNGNKDIILSMLIQTTNTLLQKSIM